MIQLFGLFFLFVCTIIFIVALKAPADRNSKPSSGKGLDVVDADAEVKSWIDQLTAKNNQPKILSGPVPGQQSTVKIYEPQPVIDPTPAKPVHDAALLDGFTHLESPAFMRSATPAAKELQRLAKLGTQAFDSHLAAQAAKVSAEKAKAQADEARKAAAAEKRRRTAAMRKAEQAALDAAVSKDLDDEMYRLRLSIERDQQQADHYEPFPGQESSRPAHPKHPKQ